MGSDPRQRGWAGLDRALVRYGEDRAGHASGEPWPADLFVLPETAGLPVEWLVVERGRRGRCLVVAADANPVLGVADLAVPAEEPGGPLSLRCHVGLWIDVETLRQGDRSGAVAPNILSEVRRRRAELETGTLPDHRLGAGGEPDPDYEDWLAEVLDPARAALLPASGAESTRSHRARPSLLAAALLLVAALAGVSALAWRFQQGEREARQRVEVLLAERRELAAEHRRQLAGQLQRLTAEHRRELAALQATGAPAVTETSPASRPLVNLAYASFYPGAARGADRDLKVPAGSDYLLLLFYVGHREPCPQYRVQVASPDGRKAWTVEGLRSLPGRELTVALPRAGLPDGRYRLRLQGRCGGGWQDLSQHEVRIES